MATQVRTEGKSFKIKKSASKKNVCEEEANVQMSEKEAFLYTAKINAAKMFSKYL